MEPITRSEMLMDGQYVEPKTRKEMILAGEDLEPVTREEYFLKKYRHSGGDVDVVQLTATENKVYTAPEGKAYNPVNVNVPEKKLIGLYADENKTYRPSTGYDGFSEVRVDVPTPPPSLQSLTASHNGYFLPSSGYVGFSEVNVDVALPQNAYLLESQKDDVVTIQHGAEFDMPRLIASIEPQQDLHGYDAPWAGGAGKNKFPIATATSSGTQNIFTAQTVSLKANTNYVLSFDSATPTTKDMSMSFNNGNTQVRGITISAGVTSFNLTFNQNVDNINWYVREAVNLSNIMIEEGSTKTAFAPYSNICPISGWGECNVSDSISINEEIESGTLTSDGMNGSSSTRIRTKNYISVKPNTTYVVDWDSDSITYFGLKGYTVNDFTTASIQGSDWIAKGSTITTDANVNYIRTNFRNNSNTNVSPSEMSKLRVTPISNYYTIDLDGTRYGGKLDVLSGVLTVDRGQKSINGGFSMASNNVLYIDDMFTDGEVNNSVISNYYPFGAIVTSTTGALSREGQFCIQDVPGYGMRYMVYDSSFASASAFNTLLNSTPLQVNYELATPQTYQLTPTEVKSLLGVNNIWADTGEVDVQIWTKEV